MATQTVNIKSTEFQPTNDFILIRPEQEPPEKVSDGGIIMLNNKTSVVERPSSGVVIATGEEAKNVEIGAFLMFPMTDGLDIEFTDGEFMLLRYESIIGFKK